VYTQVIFTSIEEVMKPVLDKNILQIHSAFYRIFVSADQSVRCLLSGFHVRSTYQTIKRILLYLFY
jgi:hypothetical protein